MPDIFCCSSVKLHPSQPDHEQKYDKFIQWAKLPSPESSDDSSLVVKANYAFRLVKHVIFGQQTEHFFPASDGIEFTKVTEGEFVKENSLANLNLHKNFRCDTHNILFELSLYQQHPVNVHQWQTNLAQASPDFKLGTCSQKGKDTESPCVVSKGQYTDPEHGFSFAELFDPRLRYQVAAISTLKSMLGFVLPRVKTNLGTNPLLYLLSLDLVNSKLKLGIEIEHLWKAKLNSDNIVTFLYEYARFFVRDSVNIGEVEDVVGRAIRRTDLLRKEHILGRNKLQEIVNQALDLGGVIEWVWQCREGALRMFTTGPDELLLDLCRLRDDEEQEDLLPGV